MKTRSVAHIIPAFELDMGGTIVKQSLPTQQVEQIDPFLLLHHFGPYDIEAGHDPLDVGPHPHRGFEPVTFLYSGGLLHKDSRNNVGELEGGDVQWMTSGMGIIHSERGSKKMLDEGGTLEGIQLWVNLPAKDKMVIPRYQDIKAADIPTVNLEHGGKLRVVAGEFNGKSGPAETFTELNAWQLELVGGTGAELPIPVSHNALVYLLDGHVKLNDNFDYTGPSLLHFRNDGEAEGITLEGMAENTRALILTGEPIGEKVTQYGPFVMNTQTEIMQAMRDYQMGKMGVYIE
ncbi:pirin [Lewinellaceae bacterium SD302]|nr:pirin [Lewinellaceae bacterium SD302]